MNWGPHWSLISVDKTFFDQHTCPHLSPNQASFAVAVRGFLTHDNLQFCLYQKTAFAVSEEVHLVEWSDLNSKVVLACIQIAAPLHILFLQLHLNLLFINNDICPLLFLISNKDGKVRWWQRPRPWVKASSPPARVRQFLPRQTDDQNSPARKSSRYRLLKVIIFCL